MYTIYNICSSSRHVVSHLIWHALLCRSLIHGFLAYDSPMAKWLQLASQSHEMYCHDLEVMSLNRGQVELGVCSTSVLSHTWIKNIFASWKIAEDSSVASNKRVMNKTMIHVEKKLWGSHPDARIFYHSSPSMLLQQLFKGELEAHMRRQIKSLLYLTRS